MILQALAFYLFATVAVFSAMMVIFQRNPVHSVLWLVLTFFNAAGLFVLLGAEFVAMLLVVVYVGAVAVLFLFVVMMLDINLTTMREGFTRYLPIGALVGFILLAELSAVFAAWGFAPASGVMRAAPTPALSQASNTEALGAILYTDYIYLFQAAGLVLLVAMIGSILLTQRKRAGVRKQSIAVQTARRVEDTMELKDVPVGKGIDA